MTNPNKHLPLDRSFRRGSDSLAIGVEDSFKRKAEVSYFSELLTSERRIVDELKFYYGISTLKQDITDINNNTILNSDNYFLDITTDDIDTSDFVISSKKFSDYRTTQNIICTSSIFFPVKGEPGNQVGIHPDVISETGIFSTIEVNGNTEVYNGFSIGYFGESKLSVTQYRNGEMIKRVSQGDSEFFDGLDGKGSSGFTLDSSNFNVFRINFSWHGVASVTFEVQGNNGVWIPFAQISFVGNSKLPSVGIPIFPLSTRIKTSSEFQARLGLMAMSSSVIGPKTSAGRRYFSSNGEAISNGSNIITMVILRVKEEYLSKINNICLKITYASFANDGNRPGTYFIIKNPASFSDNVNYQDVDVNNSVAEVSNQNLNVLGGRRELSTIISREGGQSLITEELDLDAKPGDIIVLAAKNTGNANMFSSIRWAEFH